MRRVDLAGKAVAMMLCVVAVAVGGCGWRGVNSLPLPGTEGGGVGSYLVKAELPDVTNIAPNTRVRVGDVTVGTVTKVERQGWHALITMKLAGDVSLPANAIAKVGQTSLLGTLHVELASPADEPPTGRLHNGALIPLERAGAYPSTEQTLAVTSMLLNGGGLGQIQDITTAFSSAFAGRETDLRGVINRLDEFIGHLDEQKNDIIAATEGINNAAGQFAERKPVLDKALKTIPDALSVISEQRDNLAQVLVKLGQLSALAADSVNQTKEALVAELEDIGPVLGSLADAGPALTRSLSLLATYPWPKETITNFVRGDAVNITMIIDLTLSRLDTAFFTGTRWEGNLTQLEMQWGRTIGQLPSPTTAGNPLVAPYRFDQGP
ncbi:mammalian cell entry protein [Mycolicibacter heraklionensis]|uniref:Mammalian cell entry protein n=1 Tax=Mycolicibacter heraklionensis TaxID=512402 RepID=A0ABR5FK25_9MYCO|nr:MCE family protein [Mycolicibacter heraklionensis]KLO31372.1 mammalian cell entry protein [Mycolicibacter heraklionensis]